MSSEGDLLEAVLRNNARTCNCYRVREYVPVLFAQGRLWWCRDRRRARVTATTSTEAAVEARVRRQRVRVRAQRLFSPGLFPLGLELVVVNPRKAEGVERLLVHALRHLGALEEEFGVGKRRA